jgi:prepilin-type processing-associated H-X9-DG protein
VNPATYSGYGGHGTGNEWIRLPASYHNGAAGVSFADGHAETHRWQYAATKPPALPDAARLPALIPAGQIADFDWVVDRMSVGR